ncbi:serine O-acetyltransferase [Flavobacterium sp.]|uniref:serine O-acetyltransferase n=1 Tax=Flavobacterium sp. TaxID=239 RepID=UPI004047AB6F
MDSLITSDFQRHDIKKVTLFKLFSVFFLLPNPGLKYMTIFRLCQKYRTKNKLLFYFYFLWLRSLKVKYGFDISYRTQIGAGFYIGHFGGIVIHGDTIIGDNCNISQGVTLGVSNSKNQGSPIIEDNVFLGPNACVFGNVKIGNNSVIGANTVITENVPSNCTVVNQKNNVIEKDLSEYYIHNKFVKED